MKEFFASLKKMGIGLLGELIGEYLSFNAMKKIFEKPGKTAPQEVNGKRATGTPVPTETPIHAFGIGIGDEVALTKLLSQLSPANAASITSFLKKLTPHQRMKFRTIVGTLSENSAEFKETIEKTNKVHFTQKDLNGNDIGAGEIKEDTKTTTESFDPAVEFLKKFAKMTEAEKKQTCQALGIYDSTLDNLKKAHAWFKKNQASIDANCTIIATKIEQQVYEPGPIHNADGNRIIKENLRYKGLWLSAFPTKTMRITFLLSLVTVSIMIIYGIANS